MLKNLTKTTKIWIFIFITVVLAGGALVYYFNYFGKPALFKGVIGLQIPGGLPYSEQISDIQIPISESTGTLQTNPILLTLSRPPNFLGLGTDVPYDRSTVNLIILQFLAKNTDATLQGLTFNFTGLGNVTEPIGYIKLLNPETNVLFSREASTGIHSNKATVNNLNITLPRNTPVQMKIALDLLNNFPVDREITIAIQRPRDFSFQNGGFADLRLTEYRIAQFTRQAELLPMIDVGLDQNTPRNQEVAGGLSDFSILKFNLKPNQNLGLTSLSFRKYGTLENTHLENLKLFTDNSRLGGIITNPASDGLVKFEGFNTNLAAGSTKSFEIKGSLSNEAQGEKTFGLDILLDEKMSGNPMIVQTRTIEGIEERFIRGGEFSVTAEAQQGPPAEETEITVSLAPNTPSASNIFPGETKDILKFTLSATGAVSISRITFTKTGTTPSNSFREIKLFEANSQLDDPDEIETFDETRKVSFDIEKNLSAGATSTFLVKAALKENALADTKFRIKIANNGDIQTNPAVNIILDPVVTSREFSVVEREISEPEEDQRISDLQSEIDRLRRELENARSQNQPDSAIADLQNQLRDLQNQLGSASACEAQGKYAYQGRCIDCPVSQYVANGGSCERVVQRRRFQLPNLAGADIFEIEEAVREEVAEAPQPTVETRETALQPTLESTARLRSAPEKGETGPEILIYIGILGAAHLIRRLIRK